MILFIPGLCPLDDILIGALMALVGRKIWYRFFSKKACKCGQPHCKEETPSASDSTS